MGILSKDDYFKRESNARKRMLENKEIETLSQEQHNTLERLCEIRHKIHCLTGYELFKCEHDAILDEIEGDGIIKEIRGLFGELADCIQDVDTTSLPCDDDVYYGLVDDEIEDYEDASVGVLNSVLFNWNSQVESFLEKIDALHGTNYCPTGALRIC